MEFEVDVNVNVGVNVKVIVGVMVFVGVGARVGGIATPGTSVQARCKQFYLRLTNHLIQWK